MLWKKMVTSAVDSSLGSRPEASLRQVSADISTATVCHYSMIVLVSSNRGSVLLMLLGLGPQQCCNLAGQDGIRMTIILESLDASGDCTARDSERFSPSSPGGPSKTPILDERSSRRARPWSWNSLPVSCHHPLVPSEGLPLLGLLTR